MKKRNNEQMYSGVSKCIIDINKKLMNPRNDFKINNTV